MKRGKDRYGQNWPFSLMDPKVMDTYFEQYRDKQTSTTMNFKAYHFMDYNMKIEEKKEEDE